MLDKNAVKIITKHAIRFGLPIRTSVLNLEYFATKVGLIENDGKTTGSNPNSSAKGLYQFISGSIEPAINRVCRTIAKEPWMDEVIRTRDANSLSREQQTLLFIGDILEKRGSDIYTKSIMEDRDKRSMLSAYFILHHTNPDEATRRRAEEIFNK